MAKIVVVLLIALVIVGSFLMEEISKNKFKIKDKNGKTVTRKKSDGFMPGDVLAYYSSDPFETTKYRLVLETKTNRNNIQYVKVVDCSEDGDYTAENTPAYFPEYVISDLGWEIIKNIYKVK